LWPESAMSGSIVECWAGEGGGCLPLPVLRSVNVPLSLLEVGVWGLVSNAASLSAPAPRPRRLGTPPLSLHDLLSSALAHQTFRNPHTRSFRLPNKVMVAGKACCASGKIVSQERERGFTASVDSSSSTHSSHLRLIGRGLPWLASDFAHVQFLCDLPREKFP
jgi:hypothetical protein